MKIAFVSQPFDGVFPPNQNSIGILTYHIAHHLRKHNDVVIYEGTGHLPEVLHNDQGLLHRPIVIKKIRGLNRLLNVSGINRKRGSSGIEETLYNFLYIFRIALDLRKQNCDIVHIFNYSQFAPIIRRLNPEVKVVLNMHCEWLTRLDKAIIERRLRSVDLILSCSEYISGLIRSRFPEFAGICYTLHNGVELDRFYPSPNGNYDWMREDKILFVGRVSPEKGIHTLLAAFPQIVDQVPTATLDIVGPASILPKEYIVDISDDPLIVGLASFYQGSYLDYLKQQIPPEYVLKVRFIGSVPHTEVPGCYRKAKVIVNPSYSESFGVSLIEGMASGLPVVATRTGGMPEVVEEGKTGLLVERGDVRELARAIICLLEDSSLQKSMGEKGRQRVEESFSYGDIADKLEQYYKALLVHA